MRTAIANEACKFREDRLKDGVTIYFIVPKPRGSGETILVPFLQQVRTVSDAPYLLSRVLMSCSVRMDSRAVRVWTAKKQKRKYISSIAAI